MNKSLSSLSQRWEITKGSTPRSQKHLSARSDTLWNNFISLSPDWYSEGNETKPIPHICCRGSLVLLWSWSQSLDIKATLRKMVVNKGWCVSSMGSAPKHMPRLKPSVCTEDLATDPVKQWPAEREGSLTVHSEGLLFSLALYWAMIGLNLAWSSVATSICLW